MGPLVPKATNMKVPKVVSKYTKVLIWLVLSERVTVAVLIESCEFSSEFLYSICQSPPVVVDWFCSKVPLPSPSGKVAPTLQLVPTVAVTLDVKDPVKELVSTDCSSFESGILSTVPGSGSCNVVSLPPGVTQQSDSDTTRPSDWSGATSNQRSNAGQRLAVIEVDADER